MRSRLAFLSTPALLAAAVPFWDAKPPESWTFEEARTLLTDSPWAQALRADKSSDAAPVQVYLATAGPVKLAEDRLRAARRNKIDDPSWEEYREYLTDQSGRCIVIAVALLQPQALSDAAEARRMEQESLLRIGKRKYRITGQFPPSKTDPFLRLVFPREVELNDRNLTFELYIPGAGAPYRQAIFPLKDMIWHGQPAY